MFVIVGLITSINLIRERIYVAKQDDFYLVSQFPFINYNLVDIIMVIVTAYCNFVIAIQSNTTQQFSDTALHPKFISAVERTTEHRWR